MKSAKNTKSTTKNITLADSFGQRNDYFVFAVKSDLELVPFISQLSQTLKVDCATLGDIETPLPFQAGFCSFYAYAAEDKLNLFVLENKTSRCVEEVVAESEKVLPFHTLSLFETEAFLCNSGGHCEFSWNYTNADYLFLIYVDKGHDITPFRKSLNESGFLRYEDQTEEVFKSVELPTKKNKTKAILTFFMNLFNDLDCKARNLEDDGRKMIFRHLTDEQKKLFSFLGLVDLFNYPPLTSEMVRFLLTDATYTSHNIIK